jgi:hypothetical protein
MPKIVWSVHRESLPLFRRLFIIFMQPASDSHINRTAPDFCIWKLCRASALLVSFFPNVFDPLL